MAPMTRVATVGDDIVDRHLNVTVPAGITLAARPAGGLSATVTFPAAM
jgi:hypothetical protein